MPMIDPLDKPREAFDDLSAKISQPDSPVGIDPLLTHLIIIDYLRQISERLTAIEGQLQEKR